MERFRSYSTTDRRSSEMDPQSLNKELKLKKAKSTNGSNGSSSFRGIWSLSDPEVQRMKRVARYKAYDVEGKMKGSLRRSFKWIKDKCNRVVHGSN